MKIKFKRDTSFRKSLFTADHFAHPAKMDAQLLIWLVERYTKVGETILDPMAGSGTTMLACTIGRNVILVELEQKFVGMQEANWDKVKMMPQLGCQMGDCKILQGDARKLEGLVDGIITSPPYAEAQSGGGISAAMRGKGKYKVTTKLPGSCYQPSEASENKDNISNLPYGSIDSVITSPPFSEAKFDKKHGLKELSSEGMKGRKAWANREDNNPTNPENIANKPYGNIDSIITSPEEQMLGGLIAGEGSFLFCLQKDSRMRLGYQLHPNFSLNLAESPADKLLIEQIQKIFGCGKIRERPQIRPPWRPLLEFNVNRLDDLVNKVIPLCERILPQSAKRVSYERWKELVFMMARGEHLTETGLAYIKDHIPDINNHSIDNIICSPPYEEILSGGHKSHLGDIKAQGSSYHTFQEQRNQDNIGNLKADSYLSAMLQVYQQCHKVLKPSQKECGCGIISEEVKDGQALSSRVFRRGGLRGVDRQGGKVDSRTEVKRSPEPNQGLLGESGLPEHIPLQSEIQIPTTQRETSRRIQTTSSQLPRHQDNPERPDAILDGKEGRRNQDITGDRKEASAHGEVERGRCGDAEEPRIVVNQDREVLPLLKQENTFNSSQGGGIVTKEICPKCGQAIRITGGLLILVTKNFIRNKEEVRLDEDTIKLCEQAGFQFVERHYRELPAQSFWRVIYQQRYPEAPVLDKEDILIFQRELA